MDETTIGACGGDRPDALPRDPSDTRPALAAIARAAERPIREAFGSGDLATSSK